MTIKGLRLPILGQPNPNEPKDVHLVGRYALGVTWADDHSSIYPFDRLRVDDPAGEREPGAELTRGDGLAAGHQALRPRDCASPGRMGTRASTRMPTCARSAGAPAARAVTDELRGRCASDPPRRGLDRRSSIAGAAGGLRRRARRAARAHARPRRAIRCSPAWSAWTRRARPARASAARRGASSISRQKPDATCYAALIEALTGIWNAAVRGAVVARLRAAGLPADDLLAASPGACRPRSAFRRTKRDVGAPVDGRSDRPGRAARPAMPRPPAPRRARARRGARPRAHRREPAVARRRPRGPGDCHP